MAEPKEQPEHYTLDFAVTVNKKLPATPGDTAASLLLPFNESGKSTKAVSLCPRAESTQDQKKVLELQDQQTVSKLLGKWEKGSPVKIIRRFKDNIVPYANLPDPPAWQVRVKFNVLSILAKPDAAARGAAASYKKYLCINALLSFEDPTYIISKDAPTLKNCKGDESKKAAAMKDKEAAMAAMKDIWQAISQDDEKQIEHYIDIGDIEHPRPERPRLSVGEVREGEWTLPIVVDDSVTNNPNNPYVLALVKVSIGWSVPAAEAKPAAKA